MHYVKSLIIFSPTAFSAIAMACNAVLIIRDSLLPVFSRYIGQRMLMAVITGIFFIIGRIGMAGFAARTVVTVETEVPAVIEGCGFPSAGAVARTATCH